MRVLTRAALYSFTPLAVTCVPPAALRSAEPARTVGHKMCRTALAVLLLCAAAARSAELTVSPAYADVRGGQPLLLTLPSGTRWDLEEPHCLIGAPAALRAHSAAALPAHGSRAAACEPSAPEAQGGWHGGQPAHLGPRSLPHVPPAWACLGTRGEQRVAAPQPQP